MLFPKVLSFLFHVLLLRIGYFKRFPRGMYWSHWFQNKDWIEHLSFWNKVVGSLIGRSNSIHWDFSRASFFLKIIGMLWMLSTRLNNLTPIVSKQYRQYNFFGSQIGMPNASQSNWLQHLAAETTKSSIQPLFCDQWLIPIPSTKIIKSQWGK